MDEYDILNALTGESLPYVDLVNRFPDRLAADACIRRLISSGMLKGKAEAYNFLFLTPKGWAHLLDLVKEREREEARRLEADAAELREDKRREEDRKFERRQRWLDRIVGFISGVAVTIVAELILRII